VEVIVAKDAGYCFGVRDAVQIAYEAAGEYGKVYMLGDIVHNERVVQDLSSAGIIVVDSLDDVPDGAAILLRAHGTVTDIWEQAKARDINIIDATCPLVREIHNEVKRISEDGRQVIIIGDHGHDEVNGIASQVRNPIIVATADEARSLRKLRRAAVVSQSTQMIENVQEIIGVLMTKVFDLHFVNTICFPTERNHEQIKELAEKVDVIVVIGSYTSANSKRLTQLALERNEHAHQVTGADELELEWFEDAQKVGLSAGASTPDYLIEDVKRRLEGFSMHSRQQAESAV
jgi:4-hydroxy-3-methylbut-2-enyl diphosphate reductase